MSRAFWFAIAVHLIAGSEVARCDHTASEGVPGTEIRQAVDRSIGYLQDQGATWLKQRRCAACHHVSLTLWSLSEASRMGYAVDTKFLADTAEATLGSVDKMMGRGVVPNPAGPQDPRPMARGVNIGSVFLVVAAESLPSLTDNQKQSLKLLMADVAKKQRDDGSWEFFLSRPPINESQGTDGAWIIMALQGEIDSPPAHRHSLEKALQWFATTELENRQANVLRLLVVLRSGKSHDSVRRQVDELLALQQPDGGWSQLAGAKSDAFATGQALYVLALAGHKADEPRIQKAIGFLVSTQNADGSWPMKSRATPDGRPGSAKLLTPITTGAGAWATVALSRLAPEKPVPGN